ncbi:MAG: hypothetical protein JOZ57_01770, partial [Abitibacteriaceae bacterium]|nr:hypothetical protein [Abditibacteriaceae bacterium]
RTPMRCRHCGAQFKVESALSLETLSCPHCQQRPQPITLSLQLQHLLFSSISNVLKHD